MKETVITKEAIDKLCQQFADQGKLIEAGWIGLKLHALQNASEIQISEMRRAFFGGAQHLFASIMNILEPDAEPTEKDLERMTLIHNELEEWKKTIIQETLL